MHAPSRRPPRPGATSALVVATAVALLPLLPAAASEARKPPRVIATSPADGATEVDVARDVTATFSRRMDPTTIDGSTFLLRRGPSSVAGAVSYSDRRAVFSPSSALLHGVTYVASVTEGARDAAGDPLAKPYDWTFTTAPEVATERSWGDPERLGSGSQLRVVSDARGRALALWWDGRVRARRFDPDAGWLPVETLDPPVSAPGLLAYTVRSPDVAMVASGRDALGNDRTGTAIAVWVQASNLGHQLVATRYLPAVGWTPPAVLAVSGRFEWMRAPDVAVSSSGEAVVVYTVETEASADVLGVEPQARLTQVYAVSTTEGVFGPPTLIDAAPDAEVAPPEAEVRASPPEVHGTCDDDACVLTVEPGRVEATATAAAAFSAWSYAPRVAMDACGDAVVAWTRGAGSIHHYGAVWGNRLAEASGDGGPRTWRGAQRLSGAGWATGPRVAVGALGGFAVAWTAAAEDGARRVDATFGDVREPFAAATRVDDAPAGSEAAHPDVGIGAEGDATVAYVQGPLDPADDDLPDVVVTRFEGATRTDAPRTVASAAVRAEGVAVATNAGGDGVVAWTEDGFALAAARYASARGWQAPQVLATGDPMYLPAATLGDDGTATVLWSQDFQDVYAARSR